MRKIVRRTWLILGLLLLTATGAFADTQAYKLQVDGLACPFCAYGIEKKLSAIEGVEMLDIDIESGSVMVTMADGATLEETAARRAVEAAGFSLRDFEAVQAVAPNKQE